MSEEPKQQSRTEFMTVLRETLIPDLKTSGMEFTARDFETALTFIETSFEKALREGKKWTESTEEPGLFRDVHGTLVREIRVHYCVTSTGYWGRGLSVEEAVDACIRAGETRGKVQKFGTVYRFPRGITHAAFVGGDGFNFFRRDSSNERPPLENFEFNAKSKKWELK